MKKMGVGIVGVGTVGTGVVQLLSQLPQFSIEGIAVRTLDRVREIDLSAYRLTDNPFSLLEDPSIEVMIEVAGGVDPAYQLAKQALLSGRHLVTANKELIARHGGELFPLAASLGRTIAFEATVGGGIPIISTLHWGLRANRITRVAGIVNGTTNYILTRMEKEQLSFGEALSAAQRAGFAEADPSDDVEGRDVAYKISILASLAFGTSVNVEEVYRQGITSISDLDISLAREFGYRIKMIGLAQPMPNGLLDLRVHPMLIPHHHPLAGVDGVNNAILVAGDAVGEVMLTGPGAGRLPTASAVVGDLLNLAESISPPSRSEPLEERALLPIEETSNAYYIRVQTRDIPGVIGNLGTAFGAHGVSLHSITQKGVASGGEATIILLTHRVQEAPVQAALALIKQQPTTIEIGVVLRVLV
jgi:homoserine dehydrogenase